MGLWNLLVRYAGRLSQPFFLSVLRFPGGFGLSETELPLVRLTIIHVAPHPPEVLVFV